MRAKTVAIALIGVAIAVALALTACSGGGSTGSDGGTTGGGTTGGGSAGVTVVEKGFAFDPASVEVAVGDTVTFTNEDSAPHDVEIDGKNLGEQAQGATVTWTAEKAGTFPYSCTIHPSMTGEVVVK